MDDDQKHRYKLVYLSYKVGVSSTSREYGVSRQNIYKWRRRFEEQGIDGLKTLSKARKSYPDRISIKERTEIIKFIKLNPNMTFKQMKAGLEEKGINRHWMTIYKIACKEGFPKKELKKDKYQIINGSIPIQDDINKTKKTKAKKGISKKEKIKKQKVEIQVLFMNWIDKKNYIHSKSEMKKVFYRNINFSSLPSEVKDYVEQLINEEFENI